MDREIAAKLQEILHKCQAWVDDEKYVPKKFRTKSWSNEFAENIMRELDDEMIRQKFGIEDEKIYLPTKYLVQISQEDSNEFVGEKRDLLIELLNNYVENCFRLLSIETNVRNFVRICSSAELQKGEIKVVHQWEERYSPMIRFNQGSSEDTIIAPAFWNNEIDNECETVVNKRLEHLYSLEISQYGSSLNNLPIFQPEIIIGRGSRSFSVNVALKEDLEISRHHAILTYQPSHTFNLSVVGQNPVLVGENPLFAGQTTNLVWDETFQIGSYLLKLQR